MSAISNLLTGLARGARRGIDAWHGSPYRFTEFADEAIGSGEGAQVRGFGHYLATKMEEAQKYRVPRSTFLFDERVLNPGRFDAGWANTPTNRLTEDALATEIFESALGPATRRFTGFGARPMTPDLLDESYASANKWLDNREVELERFMEENPGAREFPKAPLGSPEEIRMAYGRMRNMLTGRRVAPNPGRLYRLNVDVDPKRMIDYNATLEDQPRFVRKTLRDTGFAENYLPSRYLTAKTLKVPDYPAPTGQNMVHGMELRIGPEKTRDLLQDAGLEGVKYTPFGGAKERGEHLIVFDPTRIKILEMLAAAGVFGAAEALARMQTQQNSQETDA